MHLTHLSPADRVRSFGYVIIAVIYFYIAQIISVHAGNGLSSGVWLPLIERAILLFLLRGRLRHHGARIQWPA